jgi:inosine-uridine nucleoside N-ribohydrolase
MVSILMALQHPSVSVKALTVVHGNVPLERGLEHAKFINDLIQQGHLSTITRIPIYGGCPGPHIQGMHPLHLWEGHGPDGLGGFSLSEEFAKFQVSPFGLQKMKLKQNNQSDGGSSKQMIEKEHAAMALIRLVNENSGIHILALGPLT